MTNFYTKIKEQKLSFTLATIFAIVTCANEIEVFRYRFKDGEVVKYNTLNLSFTYLNKETELMKNVVVEMRDNIHDFVTILMRWQIIRKSILLVQWEMIFINFHQYHGLVILISHMLIQGKKIMQHLYLIGKNVLA